MEQKNIAKKGLRTLTQQELVSVSGGNSVDTYSDRANSINYP